MALLAALRTPLAGVASAGLVWAVLALAVLWMGLYPKPFTDVMHVSVTELLKHVALSKLY